MKYNTYKKQFNIKEIPIIFTDRIHGVSKLSKGIIKEAPAARHHIVSARTMLCLQSSPTAVRFQSGTIPVASTIIMSDNMRRQVSMLTTVHRTSIRN